MHMIQCTDLHSFVERMLEVIKAWFHDNVGNLEDHISAEERDFLVVFQLILRVLVGRLQTTLDGVQRQTGTWKGNEEIFWICAFHFTSNKLKLNYKYIYSNSFLSVILCSIQAHWKVTDAPFSGPTFIFL